MNTAYGAVEKRCELYRSVMKSLTSLQIQTCLLRESNDVLSTRDEPL